MPGDYERLQRQLDELPRELIEGYLSVLGNLQKLEDLKVLDLIRQGAEKRHATVRDLLIKTIHKMEIFVNRDELSRYLISCAVNIYEEERDQFESDEGLKEAQDFNEGRLRGLLDKGLEGYI